MPAKTLELQVQPRTTTGKQVKSLRRQGIVPANIFGHGTSRAIQVPAKTVEHLIAHGGRSSIVSLVLDGGDTQTALVKSYTRDPRSANLLHVDFQAVSLTQTVTTTVPLRFHGDAPAVKAFGAILTHQTTELRVEAQARNLPDAIDVDLSGLEELHAAIHVGDVAVPAGVTVLDPPQEVVAVVLPPKVEREEVEEAAAAEEAAEAAAPAEAPAEAESEPAAES